MQFRLLYALVFVCLLSFSSCTENEFLDGVNFGENDIGNGDWILLEPGDGGNHIEDPMFDYRIWVSEEDGETFNDAILKLKNRRNETFQAEANMEEGGYNIDIMPGFYKVEVTQEEVEQEVSGLVQLSEGLMVEIE